MKNLSEIKEYNFNFKRFIEDLIQEFEDNKNILKKANAIDIEVSRKIIEIEEIKNILKQYQNYKLSDEILSKRVVIYAGHPYLTINILLQAIIAKSQVLLLTDEFMLGVNNIIFSIFKKVLKNYKVIDFFESHENYGVQEIKNVASNYDEIIVIGDTTTMQLLQDLDNIEFYAYNNIILYSDNDKYEQLRKVIYKYASENEYELEIIYEEDIDVILKIIDTDKFVDIVILLSENEKIKEKFKSIKDKNVFINKNPFDSKVGKIYNYFNIRR